MSGTDIESLPLTARGSAPQRVLESCPSLKALGYPNSSHSELVSFARTSFGGVMETHRPDVAGSVEALYPWRNWQI